MKKLIPLLLIICFVPINYAAECKKKKKTCGATTIDECPKEGCGGDKELNKRKNLVTPASNPEIYRRSDFISLLFPAKWTAGSKRTLLRDWGEGVAVEYEAFLLKVTNYGCGMESTNCNLHENENNDFHLVTGHKKTTAEDDSITAEITPRFRPGGWTLTKLRKLAKDRAFIKLRGYLMLDTQHLNSSKPARATHWEIHPVTGFKVCVGSVTSCKSGDNWQELSDFSEP